MTESQSNALNKLWPIHGLQISDGQNALEASMRANKKRILEIGFGMGDSLHQMAQDEPETDFIGIEVHKPGIGRLLHLADQSGATNLHIYNEDAIEVLKHCVADNSIDRLQLFFPDPWHKNKHHKRRIVKTEFIDLVCNKLKSGGIFHAATDWKDYAEYMLKILSASNNYENMATESSFVARPNYRPITKFEKRGCRLGHGVWDILFRRF